MEPAFFATMAIARSIAADTVVDLFMLPFQNTVFLFSILYLGLASSVLSFVLFNISISSIGTNKASSFVGISTAVSVLAGVFILDEKFSAMQCYGTLIILLGVYIANMKSRFFLAVAFFTFVKAYTRENGFASGTSDAKPFFKGTAFLVKRSTSGGTGAVQAGTHGSRSLGEAFFRRWRGRCGQARCRTRGSGPR